MNTYHSLKFIQLEDSLLSGFYQSDQSDQQNKNNIKFPFHLIVGLSLFISKPRSAFSLTNIKTQHEIAVQKNQDQKIFEKPVQKEQTHYFIEVNMNFLKKANVNEGRNLLIDSFQIWLKNKPEGLKQNRNDILKALSKSNFKKVDKEGVHVPNDNIFRAMSLKELLRALKNKDLTDAERWLILFLLFIKFLIVSFGFIFSIFLVRKFFKYFLKQMNFKVKDNNKFTGMGPERRLFFYIIKFIILGKKEGKIPMDYFKLIMHLLKKSIKKIVTDHPYASVEEQAGYLLEYYYKPNYLVGLSQPLPKIYYDAYNFLKEILENSK
jgi:hypothetical protein